MILMLKSAVTAHKIYGLFHDLWLLCSVGQILPLRRRVTRPCAAAGRAACAASEKYIWKYSVGRYLPFPTI